MSQSRALLFLSMLISLVSAATYSNPIKDPNGSDPFIAYSGGYYYLTTTTWNDVQLTRARTIEGLKNGERKVVWRDSDTSRCCNVWAPEIHYIGGLWYLYYTAGNGEDLGTQRLHVLRGGPSAWDSYTYYGQMHSDWSIDGTVVRFPQGNYLVWSCFMNGSPQSLCIARMNSPNSIGPRYLLSTPTQPWEKVQTPVNEGPTAMYRNGKTYIAFSASFCWSPSYQLGLLTYVSGDPLQASSWRKSGPHFSSANGNYGTGHNSFFLSPDGTQIWNVYHATRNPNGNCGADRYTMVDIVNWNSDGTPNFGFAQRLHTIQQGPSGE